MYAVEVLLRRDTRLTDTTNGDTGDRYQLCTLDPDLDNLTAGVSGKQSRIVCYGFSK